MKAQNIVSMDVRGLTTMADYFVICGGTSSTHIQSMAQGVREKARERAGMRTKPEGVAASSWIVLDYSDVIMHIFDEETREFYDLERLWADAKLAPYTSPVAAQSSEDDRFRQSTPEPGA